MDVALDLAGRLAAGIRAAVSAVPEAAPFLAEWPTGEGYLADGPVTGLPVTGLPVTGLPDGEVSVGGATAGAGRRAQVPGLLPVCRWLEGMAGGLVAQGAGEGLREGVDTRVAALVEEVVRGAGGLEWRQTYGAGDFGADFLARYGWTELVGLRGPIPSERVAAGFLLLGPEVTYPPHAHEAAEVYLPLSGVAWWQKGDGAFAPVPVGQAIWHAPWVPHAMRTGAEPLLALYLWRGGDLAAKSVILR